MKRYLLIPSTLALPPIITTTALNAAHQGTAYSFALAATGGVVPYAWTATGLPTGITLSTAGVLSGTPTVPGSFTVNVTCTDAAGNIATESFPLSVAVSSNPQITTTGLNPAPQGAPFSQTLTVAGGQSPYVWSATTALPAGMSFSAAGVLSGTPLNVGTTAITFQVTDSFNNSASATLSLVVTAVGVTNSNVIKWFPGHKMLSNNVLGSPSPYGNGRNAAEIAALKAAYASNPGLFNGYCLQYHWADFYPNGTNSTTPDFSPIAADLAALWAAIPGCPATIMVESNVNWRSTFDPNAGKSAVPGFIFNGGTATYGRPDQGGNGAGWVLNTYNQPNPGDYGYVGANLSNANVAAAWNNFFVQLANWTGAPAVNGVSYTINNHPYIEALGDWGPDDFNTASPPSPVLSPDYNGVQYMANYRTRASVIAALPNTTFFIMPGYGAGGDGGVSEELTTVSTMAAQRVALSCTDVYYLYNKTGYSAAHLWSNLTYAQNWAVGNVNVGSNTPGNQTWNWGAGTPLVGQGKNRMGSFPNVQGDDYGGDGKPIASQQYTAALVEGTGQVAIQILGANSIYWCYQENSTPGGGWDGFILPGIAAIGQLPATNQDVPLNYMVAPMAPTQTANKPPALSWPTVQYITTYQVYRNGTAVGTVTATGATGTFTDSTETTPGSYVYTVACTNSNGVGPQSPPLTIVVPAASSVYYQYSNGVFDFANWPANNDYSGGIGETGGGGTELYEDTTYLQGGHTKSFKWSPTTTYGIWQPASNWANAPYGFDLSKYTYFTMKVCAYAAGMDFGCYGEFEAVSDTDAPLSISSLAKLAGPFPVQQWLTINVPITSLGVLGQKHFFKRGIQNQGSPQGSGFCQLDDVGYIPGVYAQIESGLGSINSPWVDASSGATCNYNVVPGPFPSTTQAVSLAGGNNPTGAPRSTFTSLPYATLTVRSAGGSWKATCPGGFNTSSYTHFSFGAQPSKTPYGYVVSAYDTSGALLGSVTIGANSSLTLQDNGTNLTKFTVYNLLLSALGAANATVGAFEIKDNSGLAVNSINLSQIVVWG